MDELAVFNWRCAGTDMYGGRVGHSQEKSHVSADPSNLLLHSCSKLWSDGNGLHNILPTAQTIIPVKASRYRGFSEKLVVLPSKC